MTRRDLFWRGVGGVLIIAAPTLELLAPSDPGSARGLLTLFLLAVTLFGLVLVAQGKKLALVLRIENSRHRALPDLIRSRRIQRRRKP